MYASDAQNFKVRSTVEILGHTFTVGDVVILDELDTEQNYGENSTDEAVPDTQTELHDLNPGVVMKNKNGKPDIMNAAWGGVYDTDKIMICLLHNKNIVKQAWAVNTFRVCFLFCYLAIVRPEC